MSYSQFAVTAFLIVACVCNAEYLPTWESLNSRPIPSWYDDAKFGIFIHWGVYSVPSWAPVGNYAEWYWFNLAQGPGNPTYEFHIKTYGQNFQYTDFAPEFRAELWDPDYWADLFVRSGAKYIVPTSKHHEGYTLWPSEQSWNWNSVNVGPQQDVIGQLFKSFRARGLRACAYYSLFEWFNSLYRGKDPHIYVEQIMLPQLYDLVNTYQPDLIFSDGAYERDSAFWNSTEFLAWLYNDSPVNATIVVNDRWGSETIGADGGYYTSEYSAQVWLDHKWELNRGIDIFSFGYNRNSQAGNYTSTYELIRLLIKTVAFGGNLLLDVGPAADGRIPIVMQERLLAIGAWLDVNGEAIYNTRTWTIQNEADDNTFYTQNEGNNAVYAITTAWPLNNQLILSYPIPTSKTVITLLGYDAPLKYSYDTTTGLTIVLPYLSPPQMPCQDAWVLKMVQVTGPGPIAPLQDYWSADGRQDNALCGDSACVTILEASAPYSRERIEGLAFTSQENGTLPLTLYYSPNNRDYATVLNHNMTDAGYTFLGIQGYAYPSQELGTVPLTLFWNPTRKDYYTVGSDASYQDAQDTKYQYVGLQGYVFPGPHYLGN